MAKAICPCPLHFEYTEETSYVLGMFKTREYSFITFISQFQLRKELYHPNSKTNAYTSSMLPPSGSPVRQSTDPDFKTCRSACGSVVGLYWLAP